VLTSQLTTPEYVRKKTVVIQTPDTMTSSGLELIDVLKLPAETEITDKDAQHKLAFFFRNRLKKAHEGQA
jgi:hypothetical protein